MVHMDRTEGGWKMTSKDPQELAKAQNVLAGSTEGPESFPKEGDQFTGSMGKTVLPRDFFPWDSIDLKKRGE